MYFQGQSTLKFLWRNWKKIAVYLFLLLNVVFWGSNLWVEWQTYARLYDEIDTIPAKKVALLLGTSKRLSDGRINLYFQYRIEAAVALYQAGKIRHIIASGDNRLKSYNEPIAMQKALIERGIPKEAITLDYAGFRTLDSIVRVKEIFSQNDIIIVSQAFHNERALFISDFYGIQAIGFNAQDVLAREWQLKMQLREYFACFKAVLDLYILRTQPRFLGEKVEISL
ncbi:MAG: hypothetical protein BWK79_02250 [Beggiatoa sp. IS2]|nr:MAG: hypothetical protein BWK79_02250 [Beggiatoa sp. IS2]